MGDHTDSSDGDEQEFEIADGVSDSSPPFPFGFGRGSPGRGRRHRHGPRSPPYWAMGGSFGPCSGYPPFGPGAAQPPPAPHLGPEAGEHRHGRHHHPYGPPHPHPHGPPPMSGTGWGRYKSSRNPIFCRGTGDGNIYVFTKDFAPEEVKVKLASHKLTATCKRARREADDITQICRESVTHVYSLPTDKNLDYATMKAKLVQGGAFLKVKIPCKKVQIPIELDEEPISEMEVLDIAKE